jgi:hypothetical protein
MEHEDFLMDINLLLIQIDELSARVHTLYETWRSRLAHPSNQPAAEVVQLVLEQEQPEPAPKRKPNKLVNPRHYWTPEEDALIIALRARGCTFPEIVQALKVDVTAGAVGNRHLSLQGGQS